MSQSCVERVIGLLATDEALRREFVANPAATLMQMAERGLELTSGEQRSLAGLDPNELSRFAEVIDARLQKIDLRAGKEVVP
jgi:hypothetical protein